MKKTLLILITILTVSLTSCKKDEPTPSNTELLTSSEWRYTKSEFFENGELVLTQTAEELVKINFNSDFTGKTTDPDGTYTWTWTFADSETKLIINDDGEIITYSINELSNSKLTFAENYTEDGTIYKDVYYLER